MARINRSEWVANVHLTPRGAIPAPPLRMGEMRRAAARKRARREGLAYVARYTLAALAIAATGLSFPTFF